MLLEMFEQKGRRGSKRSSRMQNKNKWIVNKGKSKKLALIAVSNKLIRQAFGIAKSGIPYDPMYKSKLSA